MEIFSKRLIALRKERQLTQETLAKLVNKKRSTYAGYEIEGKEPDMETICVLADFFGVTTDYLLGYSDERNPVKQAFYNDHVNFERYCMNMPMNLQYIVSRCFDSFYLLLKRDVQLAQPERLSAYQELFYTLQSLREEVRKSVEVSGGTITDPSVMSDIMESQSRLKNEISRVLDKLMQADMEIAFQAKNGAKTELSNVRAG